MGGQPDGDENRWWVREDPRTEPAAPRLRAVAYYRHSAQDRQENSIPIQQEQVQQWASENGVEIIHEFADRGKSRLTAEGRDAFNDMMDNWVKGRDDFDFVLCLDVSRWGRFQDIDLSATYSTECKRHGKQIIYTTLGKPKPNDQLYQVYVQFERFRAAQQSKELSIKVFPGCIRIAKQSYWVGGKPPYALQRLLLDEARKPVQALVPGQRKSIQNQRVTLAWGDELQVATVQRIGSGGPPFFRGVPGLFHGSPGIIHGPPAFFPRAPGLVPGRPGLFPGRPALFPGSPATVAGRPGMSLPWP